MSEHKDPIAEKMIDPGKIHLIGFCVVWIKRSDRMPEPGVRVLTVKQYGLGNQEIGSSFTTTRFPDIFDDFSDERISHWAYMPAFPDKLTEQEMVEIRQKSKNLY